MVDDQGRLLLETLIQLSNTCISIDRFRVTLVSHRLDNELNGAVVVMAIMTPFAVFKHALTEVIFWRGQDVSVESVVE